MSYTTLKEVAELYKSGAYEEDYAEFIAELSKVHAKKFPYGLGLALQDTAKPNEPGYIFAKAVIDKINGDKIDLLSLSRLVDNKPTGKEPELRYPLQVVNKADELQELIKVLGIADVLTIMAFFSIAEGKEALTER